MQIRLLGGVHVADAEGAPLDVGPAKCQAVLAALALHPGDVVSVTRMVAMVWGDDPPRTAEKTLQSYITRLRKELGHEAIVRSGAAYRLDVDPAAVDVTRFRRLLDAGDVDGALGEWTGPPLAGLEAEGLAPAVDGLVEQWLGALHTSLERQVETDPAAAIGALTELSAKHPFHEGLCALLMTALYRVGRQADALAAYRTTRNHLIEQLGVEPDAPLRALEARILAQAEDLEASPARSAATGRPTGTVSFGFADVEDATRAWVTHRHESAAAMARVEQLVRVAATEHAGHAFATRGDSFGVAFDRPADAAAWARDLQAAVGREPWPRDVVVRLRIGVHTGEAEAQGGSYFGPAVNVVTCLAAAGHGGQTLLSGATAALLDQVPGQVSGLRDLGTYRLDGVPNEQRIFQLGTGEYPPVRSDDRRRGNLPRRSGRLIGRHDEVQSIGRLLVDWPVVTLVGPGGIGKTRLALAAAELAATETEAAWLVELASVTSSSEVPRAVADALDVHESPGRSLTQAVVNELGRHSALLVLDNCEHVIDGAADLAAAVVEGCPDVHILATSRERLGITDERLVTVEPLDALTTAAELFSERATAVAASFDLRSSRRDVEELCRRLDGIPLAIELAAAQTRTMTPGDLLGRLDNPLRLLTGDRRDGVQHHRTLRANIQWSYDLLSSREQVLFQRLSCFVGPFDLLAAETVATDGDLDTFDVDELLAALVDQSAVLVEPGPFGRRFRMLESMRQLGAEYLTASGQLDEAAHRHATWCVQRATQIHQLLAGTGEIEGVARLSEFWPNLRAAVDWACAHRDAELARALVAPVAGEVHLRSQTEIADWAERILAVAPPDDHDLIVFMLSVAARRYWRTQDHDGFERLLARYGEPDHPLIHHARALVYQDFEDLVRWCPPAAAEQRRAGHDLLAAMADIGVGRALLALGRLEEGDEVVSALEVRYRAEGPPTLLVWALTMLSYAASARGDLARSSEMFDAAASVAVPDRTHVSTTPIEASAAFRRGDLATAFQVLRAYADVLLDSDDLYEAGSVAVTFVAMMGRSGHIPEAARILGYLEATGALETALFRADVADAVGRVAASTVENVERERSSGLAMDHRQALVFIRDVLGSLAG